MATRDIDYVAKDFDSIVDALITYATINFGPDTASNRQWTSFNVDDFSRTWLELVAYVGDLIFFYLDVQATQSNLQTATIRSAVLNIASQFGFVVATAASASGLAQFTLNTPYTQGDIPIGFRVASENGSQFFVSSNSPSPGSSSLQVLLPVIQGEQRSEDFTAKGVQSEEIVLSHIPLVVDTVNPISSLVSPLVTVNGNTYTMVDSFIRSTPTDEHFRLLSNAEGQSIIRFGDGVFGVQLSPNDLVAVSYRTGGGTEGNIPANTLTSLIDSNTLIDSVTNLNAFSGGSDEPTIDQLRELIPDSLKTLERAVTIDDFGDIITANFNSVSKAVAERNTTDPGIDVNIYVVPAGNTITAITDNLPLFTAITDFIDERKTVTTVFTILDAYPIDILIKIKASLSSGASRSLVESNVTAALEGFFDLNEGDVDGTGTKFGQQTLLNDIYNLIDQIEGIDRFEIKKLHYRPRVESATATGTNYLASGMEVFPNSSQYEWLVAPDSQTDTPNHIPFSVFRKLEAKVSNLGEDSLSADELNFSVIESTATGINTEGFTNTLFDFTRTFLVDEYVGGASDITITNVADDTWDHSGEAFAPRPGDRIVQGNNTARIVSLTDDDTFVLASGYPDPLSNGAATLRRDEYLLVDSAGNVWTIDDNDAHSFVLSAFAINNTVVSDVTGGAYKIVESLIGANILFHDLIFPGIEYNTHDTVYRANSSFNLVGTIGDAFQISRPQLNKGSFGIPVTLDDFETDTPSAGLGRVHVAGNPDLSAVTVGLDSNYTLLDSNLEVFEIVAVDNIAKTLDILHENGVTENPAYNLGLGRPGVIAPRYYSDRSEVSFVLGLANKETGVGFQAIGNIAIASREISAADRATNVVTLTFGAAHPFETGQEIKVENVTDPSFDGTFTITDVPDTLTLTYDQVDVDASSTGGKASLTGTNISDGTLLTISDGDNPATTFEFNKVGGVAGGNVEISFSDSDAAIDIKAAMISAIQGAPDLAVSASDGTGTGTDEIVFLQNDNIGPVGNQAIVDTISVAGIVIAGMSGGLGSGHGVPTPVIPAPGDSVNDFGISSDGTIVDHFQFRTSGFVDDIVNLRNSEIPQISATNIELDFRGGVT
jgi:hypothetical protein